MNAPHVSRQLDASHTVLLASFLVLWSSGSIATAIGLDQLDPWVFLLLRSLGTSVVAWAVWAWVRDPMPSVGNGARTARWAAWRRTIVTGVLMQFLYQAAFFWSLAEGIAPGLLTLVVATQPLVLAVFSDCRRGRTWVGVVLGFTGLLVACWPDLDGGSSALGLAAAVAALAAITAATWRQSNSSAVGRWAALAVHSAASLPLFAAMVFWRQPPIPEMHASTVVPILWMVLVVGFAATGLLYALVRTIPVVLVTSTQLLVPAATALLDMLVRGTALPLATVIGMTLTLPALLLLAHPRRG